ncbi:MAG: hypothetical protein WAM85_20550 [Terracidiphilus sp.]
MKTKTLLRATASLALLCSLSCLAQDKGYWRAASNTANSITGDIALSDKKITLNFNVFPIVRARDLRPAEVSAVFDADVNAGRTGTLYRLTVPASRRFLHHNTLCGTEDTQWMATFVSDRTLQVAFFSGSEEPVFTMDALRNSTDLCGTFSYAR